MRHLAQLGEADFRRMRWRGNDPRDPEHAVRRTSFISGGHHGWRISAIETPRVRPAPWKIVVTTGAPSWAEYWAETLAELP